jgi:DNA-binding NtrC family response regulator
MSTSGNNASRAADCTRPFGPGIQSVDYDLELAASTDVPVLLSGEPAASLELACEIYRRSNQPTAAVFLIDCRHDMAAERVAPIIDGHASGAAGRMKVLLLLEVHALSPEGQAVLERHVERALLRSRHGGSLRVIAASSISLFDRVAEGLFRERLYYFLNMIHIVVPPHGRLH